MNIKTWRLGYVKTFLNVPISSEEACAVFVLLE